MKYFGILWLCELSVKKIFNSENILVYLCKIKDLCFYGINVKIFFEILYFLDNIVGFMYNIVIVFFLLIWYFK